jgi:N-acetylmuramoyl-L-alanine amidase
LGLALAAGCDDEIITRFDAGPALTVLAPEPIEPPRAPEAELRRIDVYGVERRDAASARVVLLFDGAPLFHQRRLSPRGPLPARIAIELPGVRWGPTVSPSVPVGAGGIERIRLAEPNSRVVVDLQRGATGRVFYLTDPYRIVIDVETGAAETEKTKRPVVVLDPGHGGAEPGAANDDYGLVESVLALEIAELTRDRLHAILPTARVLLTREDDTDLSLEARCALANAMESDVFVSLHLNASTEPVRKGGVTTFVLDTTNDRQALRLAARENRTNVGSVTGIQTLLARLHRSTQTKDSRRLASMIQRSTLKQGRSVLPALSDRGVRASMFYVLVGARMPSVLVEASFLTYEPEARALSTRLYRRRLASGIASGIAAYLEAQ